MREAMVWVVPLAAEGLRVVAYLDRRVLTRVDGRLVRSDGVPSLVKLALHAWQPVF